MQSFADQPNPPPSTENGTLFPTPSLQEQVLSLTQELERERAAHKEAKAEWLKMRRQLHGYQHLNSLYISLKADAEAQAQAPIDQHYREALGVLEAIASDETACSCHARSWHGEGHDTRCPIRIATDAHPLLKADAELAKAGAA
jgi:hypothetical protein